MLTIRRALEAKKAARENGEEAGFSLIELIIVVVILGILVAIAIPIFGGIQASARKSAVQAAATNAATAYSAAIAAPPKTPDTRAADAAQALTDNQKGNIQLEDGVSGGTLLVEKVCVKGTDSTDAAAVWYAGQGAKADGSGCKP